MACKAILFDLDGTLVDTVSDLANAMNFALQSFGQPAHSVEACKQMIGSGVKKFAQRALAQDSQNLQDEVLSVMRARYHDKCLEHSRLYDGVFDTVKKLRDQRLRLAVVTNKDQTDAERIVEHFFGADTFECVVGVVGNMPVKPDTTGTMKIVESMGLRCEDFLFVGDAEVDVRTAASAKIRSVGASWGFRGRDELVEAKADIIIDSPVEILDLVA
jgi:phosphoglycolate phosphatase